MVKEGGETRILVMLWNWQSWTKRSSFLPCGVMDGCANAPDLTNLDHRSGMILICEFCSCSLFRS